MPETLRVSSIWQEKSPLFNVIIVDSSEMKEEGATLYHWSRNYFEVLQHRNLSYVVLKHAPSTENYFPWQYLWIWCIPFFEKPLKFYQKLVYSLYLHGITILLILTMEKTQVENILKPNKVNFYHIFTGVKCADKLYTINNRIKENLLIFVLIGILFSLASMKSLTL